MYNYKNFIQVVELGEPIDAISENHDHSKIVAGGTRWGIGYSDTQKSFFKQKLVDSDWTIARKSSFPELKTSSSERTIR